jgi:hypothetical protein
MRDTGRLGFGGAVGVGFCLMPLLLACGGSAVLPGHDGAAASGGPSAGSSNASGGAGATGGTSAAGTSTGGSDANGGASPEGGASAESGAAGGPDTEPPVASFAGRWALIMSEEFTGVQLLQAQSTLSGTGCGGGVPPFQNVPIGDLCGALSGSAHGTQATFAYQFMYGDYVMTTTISADGSRMTGHMSDKGALLPYPTAWVRLMSDANWLPNPPRTEMMQRDRYSLALSTADAGATEYVAGKAYSLRYVRGDGHSGLEGDLGTFSPLELSMDGADGADSANGTLHVGPVSETEPQLAVSLTIQIQNAQFTQVAATTGNGHHFTFTATPVPWSP